MGPRLGHLKEENGKLIMVRISGFGQTGPYSPRPGFGRIGNAFGGLSYLAGFPDRPPTTPGSATIPDYIAGLYGALGVMFALRARDMTGRGQYIDIGLYEPIFRILDELAASYHYKGYLRERMGPGTVNVCPAQPLPDQGRQVDRDRLHVGQDLSRGSPELQGEPELAGAGKWGKVKDRGSRPSRGRRLGDAMDREAHARGPDRACDEFQVPCGPVYSICRDLRGPAVRGAREHQALRRTRASARSPCRTWCRASPTRRARSSGLGRRSGEHNDEVYKGLLGLPTAEIARLKDKGVI